MEEKTEFCGRPQGIEWSKIHDTFYELGGSYEPVQTSLFTLDQMLDYLVNDYDDANDAEVALLMTPKANDTSTNPVILEDVLNGTLRPSTPPVDIMELVERDKLVLSQSLSDHVDVTLPSSSYPRVIHISIPKEDLTSPIASPSSLSSSVGLMVNRKKVQKVLTAIQSLHYKIYSMIRQPKICPSYPQDTFELFNMPQVWSNLLSTRRTLSWHIYKYCYSMCFYLKECVDTANTIYKEVYELVQTLPHEPKDISEDHYKLILYYYKDMSYVHKDACNVVRIFMGTINHLNQTVELPSDFKHLNEGYGEFQGIEWLTDIINVYLEIQGAIPCTPEKMMDHFKEHIESLEDDSFFLLISHIERVLGNSSLDLIKCNLLTWLRSNWSGLPEEVRSVFALNE